MSFDTKCYDLAEYFLDGTKHIEVAKKNELAQLIQTTIEDYIKYTLEGEPENEEAPNSS